MKSLYYPLSSVSSFRDFTAFGETGRRKMTVFKGFYRVKNYDSLFSVEGLSRVKSHLMHKKPNPSQKRLSQGLIFMTKQTYDNCQKVMV